MAKIVKCEICGKEETVGFWGDNETVFYGTRFVSMCEDCYKTYDAWETDLKKRIDVKLNNHKRLFREASQEDLVKLVKDTRVRFDESLDLFLSSDFDNSHLGCFHTDGKGHFIVKEAELGFANSDVTLKEMKKREKKSDRCGGLVFTKDDISNEKILYSRPMLTSSHSGRSDIQGQSYTIMLNDPSKLSVKPCFVKASVVITGCTRIFTGNKDIDVIFEAGLYAFLREIGSDAKIERIKKFKKGAI